MPHFSLECLKIIDEEAVPLWPDYDEELLVENIIPFVIQINGKKRGLINTKLDLEEDDLLKLVKKDQNINKYLTDKEVRKKIYIKNKLMNIII